MRSLLLIASVRSCIDDRKGAGAVELALALPTLLIILLGMIDASSFIAARLDLEQAAQRTTDYALAVRPTSDDATYLRSEAAAAADVSTSDVTAEIFLECDGVRQSSFSSPCPTGQTPARFVSISIVRDVQTQFDWAALASLFGVDVFSSTIRVSGTSLVRFQ